VTVVDRSSIGPNHPILPEKSNFRSLGEAVAGNGPKRTTKSNKIDGKAPRTDELSTVNPGLTIKVTGLEQNESRTAVPATGSMRSPLLKTSAPTAPKSPTPPKNQPAPTAGDNAGNASDNLASKVVSEIGGLSANSRWDQTSSVIVNYALVEQEQRSLRRKTILGFVAMCGLFVVAMMFVPAVRKPIDSLAARLGVGSPSLEDGFELPAVTTGAKGVDQENAAPKNVRTKSGHATPACSQLVGAGIAALLRESLTMGNRVAMAECYLLADTPHHAEQILSGARADILRTSEQGFSSPTGRPTMVAVALLMTTHVSLIRGRYGDVDELVGRYCRIWDKTVPCVAKLMALTTRGFWNSAIDAVRKMSVSQKKLDPVSNAFYMMAAAIAANSQADYRAAEDRFTAAERSAPANATFLKRRIYETWATALYARGEYTRVVNLVTRSQKALAGTDQNIRHKLRLLADLSRPNLARKSLTTFLAKDELSHRVRGDVEFLGVLGPEAFRFGRSGDFLRLARASTQQIKLAKVADPKFAVIPGIWEVRALLAMNQSEGAIARIKELREEYGASDILDHLHGVGIFISARSRATYADANRHFRLAAAKKPGWEQLYAVGITLLRSGRASQVGPVVDRLKILAKGHTQNFWVTMLKAELMIAQGKARQARVMLEGSLKLDPSSLIANQLLANALHALGDPGRAELIEADLNNGNANRSYYASREGLSSPVGAMALATRPAAGR